MRTPTHDGFPDRLDSLNGSHSNMLGPELGRFSDADRRVDELSGKETKAGTTTVGTKTEEGVVFVTGMCTSMGYMTSSKDVQKVEEIHPAGALTIVGSVSAAQSFISSLRAEVRLYGARRGEDISVQALSTLVGSFFHSGGFYIVQSILGDADEIGPYIHSIDPAGSILKEEYTATGSGNRYTLGVLRQEFEGGLSIGEVKGAATKAVRSAVERDLASGNGTNIVIVTEGGVGIQRHQNFEGLE